MSEVPAIVDFSAFVAAAFHAGDLHSSLPLQGHSMLCTAHMLGYA
jgi:hypothetical protein